MKNIFLLSILIIGAINVRAQQFLSNRDHYILKEWQFAKVNYNHMIKRSWKTNDWKEVVVPHTWNANDVLTIGTRMYHGVGSYKHNLNINKSDSIKRHFIRFEGVSLVADVYVNGKFVGNHKGAYSAFCFEITRFLQYDKENVVAVRVHNVPDRNIIPESEQLFPLFGGIYRPVTYFTTSKTCISPLDYASSGIYIQQKNVTNQLARIEVKSLISLKNILKDLKLNIKILDQKNNIVNEVWQNLDPDNNSDTLILQSIIIENPHLWNAKKDPYSYTCEVSLIKGNMTIDKVAQSFGLRYFRVDKNKGFLLNGSSLPLYGVCRHQEWEGYGSALSYKQHKQDIDYILEMGANSIRLAHYQQAEDIYKLSDENGLVIWAEIPVTPPYIKDNPIYL